MTNLATILWLTVATIWSPASAQTPGTSVAVSLPDGFSLSMPEILTRPMPVPLAIGGQVVVEIVVSVGGAVAQTRVAKSTDQTGALDRACVDALQHWRFRPAMNNGRPMASLVLIRFSAAQPNPAAPLVVDASLMTLDYVPGPEEWAPPPEAQATAAVTSLPGGVRGVRPPSVLREVRPSYTAEAIRAKIVGSVEVNVVVAADGTVAAAKVVKSLDVASGLDRAALIAARYWLFKPGTLNGVPAPSTATLILEFRLH